jgi:hypothetical protein
MVALLTACGRNDLLLQTLNSFFEGNKYQVDIIVHEDAKFSTAPPRLHRDHFVSAFPGCQLIFTNQIGQHKSIEMFLRNPQLKSAYYIHLEDDWMFNNSYDWISQSIEIMEQDPLVIKVLAREGSPHPCKHDRLIKSGAVRESIQSTLMPPMFGYLEPWTGEDGIKWHGFSWNPGVTRVDLLRKFIPFPKWEQELAEQIYQAGYKVVSLEKPIYSHIGEGRSTH